MKILKDLRIEIKKDIEAEGIESYGYIDIAIEEAIQQLEEQDKEDLYIYEKMNESLHMGARAQSIVFVEVYKIIENRIKSQKWKNEHIWDYNCNSSVSIFYGHTIFLVIANTNVSIELDALLHRYYG